MTHKHRFSSSYHRNLLERYLFKFKNLISGEILDIGSKNRRYDSLFRGKITAIDINPKPDLNIIPGNITKLDFSPNRFDSIICLEVFEYLKPEDFKLAYHEIHKVLKQNGKVIITIPFYFGDHEDKLRYTYGFINDYLKESNLFKFQIFKFGNRYIAMYDMIRNSLIKRKSKITRILSQILILAPIYLVLKIFSLERKVDDFYSGLFLILKKM